jgi:hypothetical protein
VVIILIGNDYYHFLFIKEFGSRFAGKIFAVLGFREFGPILIKM